MITEEQLREECRKLGREMQAEMVEGVGFMLLLFNYGPDGSMAYISSARREDCLKVLRELQEHMESHTN